MMGSEASSKSWGDRHYFGLILGLLLITVLVLWSQDLLFFASDYLSGFYPYRGYPDFQGPQSHIANAYYQDVAFFFYPFWSFAGEMISQGILPLWSPLEGAGFPAAAAHVEGTLFPLRWLTFGLLPPIWAWQVEMGLIFLVSSVSAYLYFKSATGNAQGATLAALSWTLAGGLGTYFQQPAPAWPLALLPTVLWGLKKIEEGKAWAVPLVSLSTAVMLVTGHLQYSAVVGLIAGLTALYRANGRWLKIACLFMGVLISLPHLIPLAELLSLSNRVGPGLEKTAESMLAPREYLNLLFPFINGAPSDGFYLGRSLSVPIVNGREHCLYIGQITLLLALFAAGRAKSKTEKGGLFLMGLGLITAGSIFLYKTFALIFPPLVQVTPLRYLPFIHFGICYLAARGWDALPERVEIKDWRVPLVGVSLILVGVATFVVPATFQPSQFAYWLVEVTRAGGIVKPPYFEGDYGPFILNKMIEHFQLTSSAVWMPLVLLVVGAVGLMQKEKKKRFAVCLSVLLLDLLFFFFSFNIPTPESKFYPPLKEFTALEIGHQLKPTTGNLPTRVLGLGRGLHPNILLAYGIANFEVYASVLPGEYRKIFEYWNGDEDVAHQLASVVSMKRLTPGALDIFGIDTLYDHPPEEARGTSAPQLLIFPPRDTALRAFLSSAWTTNYEENEIYGKEFDPRRRVLLKKAPSFATSETPGEIVPVKATYYGCNRAEFRVKSDAPALLVLTDLYYPGWEAQVNGDDAAILEAYDFCRAVEVPEGESVVVFEFRPTGWTVGLLGLALGLLGCVVLGLYVIKRSRASTNGES